MGLIGGPQPLIDGNHLNPWLTTTNTAATIQNNGDNDIDNGGGAILKALLLKRLPITDINSASGGISTSVLGNWAYVELVLNILSIALSVIVITTILSMMFVSKQSRNIAMKPTLRISASIALVDIILSSNLIAQLFGKYMETRPEIEYRFITWMSFFTALAFVMLTCCIVLQLQLSVLHNKSHIAAKLNPYYELVTLLISLVLTHPIMYLFKIEWIPRAQTIYGNTTSPGGSAYMWLTFLVWMTGGLLYCLVVSILLIFKLFPVWRQMYNNLSPTQLNQLRTFTNGAEHSGYPEQHHHQQIEQHQNHQQEMSQSNLRKIQVGKTSYDEETSDTTCNNISLNLSNETTYCMSSNAISEAYKCLTSPTKTREGFGNLSSNSTPTLKNGSLCPLPEDEPQNYSKSSIRPDNDDDNNNSGGNNISADNLQQQGSTTAAYDHNKLIATKEAISRWSFFNYNAFSSSSAPALPTTVAQKQQKQKSRNHARTKSIRKSVTNFCEEIYHGNNTNNNGTSNSTTNNNRASKRMSVIVTDTHRRQARNTILRIMLYPLIPLTTRSLFVVIQVFSIEDYPVVANKLLASTQGILNFVAFLLNPGLDVFWSWLFRKQTMDIVVNKVKSIFALKKRRGVGSSFRHRNRNSIAFADVTTPNQSSTSF
ncbi:hypothetical protein H4219_003664 [Mycoemilia scoparia]|uniref:Uncharacterized protein n=1 Tax=Mycoemilia scoparia TaxID=417184 RepID=A0A9W7ZUX5_9FUNG|nr:hypothetical protein H4219_003664 [Mycoemilia scoparia]